VCVIGAGLAGVGIAVKLKQAGFDFTVYEKYPGPGGVWWANTYPGCEVDVPSHAYSYSFMRFPWSRTCARQPELQKSVQATIDHFQIGDRFRYSTRVDSVEWQDERACYLVRTEQGDQQEFEAVVSCVGMLDVPKFPDWPGLDSFAGPCFHTARWEHQHDLRGKRVAFVGTGSTGSQAIPAIAPEVEHLYVFQREPGWILPKPGHDFSPEERARFEKYPLLVRWHRYKTFWQHSRVYRAQRPGSRANAKAHRASLEYLESVIADPELRAAVTPEYVFGCKRVVLCSEFYPALVRDNVTLVPKAVSRLTTDGIVDADGTERKVDAVIMSTGFHAQKYLSTLKVSGEGGRQLHAEWQGSPAAILGMMVPGFPNFFMLYGPNTNGPPSILANLELQANVVLRCLKRIGKGRPRVVSAQRRYLDLWTRFIDHRNSTQQGVATAGCNNYYFAPDGRNVTQYPGWHYEYRLLAWLVPPIAFRTRAHDRAGAP
jgi:cation diffusion facilitator CzcD-associated flavoprotein CzcO